MYKIVFHVDFLSNNWFLGGQKLFGKKKIIIAEKLELHYMNFKRRLDYFQDTTQPTLKLNSQ